MSEQGKDAEWRSPVLREDIRGFAVHLRDDPPVYRREGSTVVLRAEIWDAVLRERRTAARLLDRYAAAEPRATPKSERPKSEASEPAPEAAHTDQGAR